ncbi:MAG TPA: haloacid dehalogenase type II [Terriglobales bacterium]|nr:haloacid dehalogenase type II [Terriglobales bacterium]
MLDFQKFRALTFDCYGTLIDWETGIFSALRPILRAHGKTSTDAEILEIYSDLEAGAEQGEFHAYREVLRRVVEGFGERLGFVPSEAERISLPASVPLWNPFPDTCQALARLKSRYQLVIISNVDEDLFAKTRPKLGVEFDHVITAGRARCYKPGLAIFKLALKEIGVPAEQVLHAGQSIYHDVIPAQSLGMATAWVNRPSPRPNAGAAKKADGKPDLEVRDLKRLADAAGV